MASLLHVERSTLEGNIHENRCDEIGAIFNLLMDDALREKGLWEGDHTRRRDRSRRRSTGGHRSAPPGETMVRSTSQTPTGEQRSKVMCFHALAALSVYMINISN